MCCKMLQETFRLTLVAINPQSNYKQIILISQRLTGAL